MREHRRTLRVRSTLLDEDLEDSVPRKYSHLDGASILVVLHTTLFSLRQERAVLLSMFTPKNKYKKRRQIFFGAFGAV